MTTEGVAARKRGPGPGGKPVAGILSILRSQRGTTGEKGTRLIEFILANAEDIIGMSVTDIADAVDVSESYVIKICRQLGVNGLQQLKISIGQDLVTPTQFIQEDLNAGDDVATANKKIFHANIAALQETLNTLDAAQMERAVDYILNADRIELYGIGSAAPIAADAHYRMMRIGLRTRMTDDAHLQAVSASLCDNRTAVITISHSGSTKETIAATRLAHLAGAKTILITGYKKSPIQRYCDVVLQTMARETKFRSEAMASRIAQLTIVDALIANLALRRHDISVTTLQHTFEVLGDKRF